MKLWLWLALAGVVAAVLGFMPFERTDVAKLRPVEVIAVSVHEGNIEVDTDTDASGTGEDLNVAFENMKKTTPGNVFLDTADFLLLEPGCEDLLPELTAYLRPGCQICLCIGKLDMEKAAMFLRSHEPGITLQAYRAEMAELPMLVANEEEMELVYG